jgi:uncharacterized integral membrane protein
MTYQPGIDPPSQPVYPPAGPPAAPPDAPAPITNPPQSESTELSPAGLTSHGQVRPTRASALWVGLIVAALLLIALLIFIVQNSKAVTIHYLGFHGRISLAIALLLAAVAGLLLVAVPGTARIVQLRRALKKNASAAHTKH